MRKTLRVGPVDFADSGKSRARYRRAALGCLLAGGLVLFTAFRDRQAVEQAGVEGLVARWRDKVQCVPPLAISQVDPSRPVYVSGILRRRQPASDLDDPEVGVNFGSCVFAYRSCDRWVVDPQTGEKQRPDGPATYPDYAPNDSRALAPPGGAELAGAQVDQNVLRRMAVWMGYRSYSKRVLSPPAKAERLEAPHLGTLKGTRLGELHPRATRDWRHYKPFRGKDDLHASSRLEVCTDPSGREGVTFRYEWAQPHQVYFFGGVKNGALAPFDGILTINQADPTVPPKTAARLASLSPIFTFSVKSIDIDKLLAHAEREQAARTKADPFNVLFPTRGWPLVSGWLSCLVFAC